MRLGIINWQATDPAERRAALARPTVTSSQSIQATVAEIARCVKADGDAAVRRFTAEFDRVELEALKVSDKEIQNATRQLPKAAIDAIDTAITNVTRFHKAQLPRDISIETMPGVKCTRTSRPIDAVGMYVPAGSAPLPSAAIMLAVPAAIANCPTRILCTPPDQNGNADAAVLVAASRAGVRNIYKSGGAQAIAAMAYGTASIPKVHKIMGPGNAWVTAAKSYVSSDPDGAAIDMPAGPSEVLVIADASANAEFVAADLLSQAEHGPDSQVILLTPSLAMAEAVSEAVSRQIATLSRADIAKKALQSARLIVVESLAQALEVSNAYAPEHLILQCNDAPSMVVAVRNAGSVFVGHWSPESVGDYCSGTNHVLPTYGYARSYGGLSVEQFMRSMTVQELTRDGLKALSGTVITLAELEGLDGHAAAVTCRVEAPR